MERQQIVTGDECTVKDRMYANSFPEAKEIPYYICENFAKILLFFKINFNSLYSMRISKRKCMIVFCIEQFFKHKIGIELNLVVNAYGRY